MGRKVASGLIIGLLRKGPARARATARGWCFDIDRNRVADTHWASLSDLGRLAADQRALTDSTLQHRVLAIEMRPSCIPT
ncbi:MAG TPA: hypothetical protein VFZ97_17535 [Acidimicrobiales bacterium]